MGKANTVGGWGKSAESQSGGMQEGSPATVAGVSAGSPLASSKPITTPVAKHNAAPHDDDPNSLGSVPTELAMRMDVGMDSKPTSELTATGDASWGSPGEDVYAFLIKRSGGPVAHARKNTGVVCDASFDSESVASTKTAHKVLYVQEIERAFGVSGVRPTTIGTDSSSNLAVARRQGAAARSRHSLRRWANLIKRMEDNEIYLAKVGTAEMPCDFLTKWVSKEKLRKSLEFATNSLNEVAIGGKN